MTTLLSVDDALARILEQITPLDAEQVPLMDALGRVLALDVQSEINLPPFANSSMDGYAVRADDLTMTTTQQPTILQVVMDIPAGAVPSTTLQPGQAARIMTGAPLPDGADAIIPVEDTDGGWDATSDAPPPTQVQIFRQVGSGAYVRPAGEDISAGTTVLKAGTVLRPQEIGVLAALGQAQVDVIRRPRVTILTSGDELVQVDQPLTPGKIRDVNSYTLSGLVTTNGGEATVLPIAPDTPEGIQALFENALAHQPDIILSSAGVSVGAADLVKHTLEALGEVNFWRINLKPGKPLAFGKLRGVPFFGLPGNPVSAMVTFDVLVRPALLKQAQRLDDLPMATAVVEENIQSDGRRTYLRVKLYNKHGRLTATRTGTQSSGALMSMVLADGLLIIPEGQTHIDAGTELKVRLLKTPVSDA